MELSVSFLFAERKPLFPQSGDRLAAGKRGKRSRPNLEGEG